jgi:branched-chain amino acid transport system ATP-binding protein
MGLWTASQGEIHFADHDITRLDTPGYRPAGHCLCAGRHGHLHRPDGGREHDPGGGERDLSIRSGWTWIKELFPPIGTFWNSSAGTLSGGQKQMLSLRVRSSSRAA